MNTIIIFILIYLLISFFIIGLLLAIDNDQISAFLIFGFFGLILYPILGIKTLIKNLFYYNQERLDIGSYLGNKIKLIEEYGRFYNIKLLFLKKKDIPPGKYKSCHRE